MPKVHNEELAKQWSLTLLSMYYYSLQLKLYSKYEKIQLMGYFRSPLIVMLNTVKSMMAVLVRRFYDVCKYKASAKRSSWTHGTAKLSGVYTHARSRVRLGPMLTFFLPLNIALQTALQNSRRELPWAMLRESLTIRHPRK